MTSKETHFVTSILGGFQQQIASSHSAVHTHKHRKLETELQTHRRRAGWQPVWPCFLSVFTAQFHFHFLGSDSNVIWLCSSLYITGPSKYSGDGEANRNENWHYTNQKVGSPSKISELGIICWLLTKSHHLIETKSTKFRTHSELYLHVYACIPSDCSFQYISATNGSNLHKQTARWTV